MGMAVLAMSALSGFGSAAGYRQCASEYTDQNPGFHVRYLRGFSDTGPA
jgi:hypothetical protein